MNASRKPISRREFLKLAGVGGSALVLASCAGNNSVLTETSEPIAPTATTAAVPPTPAPTATMGTLTDLNWDIYPKTDPRYWVLDKVIDPPKKYSDLVISQNIVVFGSNYKEGESAENNAVSTWLQEKMGIHYQAKWSGADVAQYWPTALGSGDLPELMTNIYGPQYVQLREADMLEDIQEIWDTTASELTKKKKQYPDGRWWKAALENGKMYGIPQFGGGGHNLEDIFWVRQDWLDQVGMSIPTTFDEVTQVGKAFMDAGLSKSGIFLGSLFSNGFLTMSFVFGAYGTLPRSWKRGSDGKLAYTSLEPAQKDGLAVLRQWYQDGILDKDYLTVSDYGKSIGGNLVGMAAGPWWLPLYPMPDSLKNDPNARWVPADLPGTADGIRGRYGDPMVACPTSSQGGVVGFLKGIDPIKVEAFINQMNWFYEMEENRRIGETVYGQIFQVPGYDYDMEGDAAVGGKYSTQRYNLGAFDFNANRYPEIDLYGYQLTDELMKLDPAKLNPLQKLTIDDQGGLTSAASKAIKVAFEAEEYTMYSDYLWLMPTNVAELVTSLETMETDVYSKIITGQADISAWDEFASDWMKQGGDEVTAAVNEEDQKHV